MQWVQPIWAYGLRHLCHCALCHTICVRDGSCTPANKFTNLKTGNWYHSLADLQTLSWCPFFRAVEDLVASRVTYCSFRKSLTTGILCLELSRNQVIWMVALSSSRELTFFNDHSLRDPVIRVGLGQTFHCIDKVSEPLTLTLKNLGFHKPLEILAVWISLDRQVAWYMINPHV